MAVSESCSERQKGVSLSASVGFIIRGHASCTSHRCMARLGDEHCAKSDANMLFI